MGDYQIRFDKLLTDVSEPCGHPTHAAHGQSKSNRSIAHDEDGCSDAETQNVDNDWQSVADTDPEASGNEDADAEVPESDDPDLTRGGPVLLSAKLAAEVHNFGCSGYRLDIVFIQRPVWVNAKRKDTTSKAPVSHRSQTQQLPTARHALKSISNNDAHAEVKPTVRTRHNMMWVFTDSCQRDANKALPELDKENQISQHNARSAVRQAEGAEHRWPSYTNLIWSSNGEVNLTSQTFEVKAVVRKAIPLILSNLIFVDGYPDQPTRSAWGKKALISAASDLKIALGRNSQGAAAHYDELRRRLKRQDDYWPHLSRLVRETRCSHPHSHHSFSLMDGSASSETISSLQQLRQPSYTMI